VSGQDQQTRPGPDVLRAFAYGNGITEIKMAALDQARELYGEKAMLKVEAMGHVGTAACWTPGGEQGRFCAYVYIRCLDLNEEDL
jgi:hypothetical protein